MVEKQGAASAGNSHDKEYFQHRELKKGAAGWILLSFLGVAYVISGDFAGWNFGIGKAGWGGLLGSVQKVLQKRKDHGMWCLAEHPHLRRRKPWSKGNLSLAWVK